ncbi:MAG: hypothetical protein IPP27_14920 [Bacteroidetes bacterium]|jgi:hypothetical protein|nr:hypothetical protein [Bacteroidota bacterium]MBP6426711.1 hypothetical protein [Bacteroidia bacterium]MBK8363426.1 hypothetical protein [Bacteroidota bacterium]MBK9414802.1 hypothetical protein [Bacteroidota bacterium]MBL0033391.1 hypothetical protein [Bacteroidota bacterium]
MNTRTLSIRLTGYLIFFSSFDCSAQNTYPVMSMDVATEAVGNHLTADSLPILTDTTIFDVGMNLNLYDTTNIQSIEVKIGSSPGASDVFSRNFTFDVSGSLGSGISYLRDEYAIHLGLGNLQQMLSYYSQVRIQRTDGSYNTAVVFNR